MLVREVLATAMLEATDIVGEVITTATGEVEEGVVMPGGVEHTAVGGGRRILLQVESEEQVWGQCRQHFLFQGSFWQLMQPPQLEQTGIWLLCLYLELDVLDHVVLHHHDHGDGDEGGLMVCKKDGLEPYPLSSGGFHTATRGFHHLHETQRSPGRGPFATTSALHLICCGGNPSWGK